MRQRSFALLAGLTLMLGTVVVASGILADPLPSATTVATADAERDEAKVSRAAERHMLGPRADIDSPRTPRAETQDPDGVPGEENPAPVREIPPGGIDGVDVPLALDGEYVVHPGKEAGPDASRNLTIRVEVEEGLPVSTAELSEFVMATLNDERSWARDGAMSFSRTDGRADLRIILASPRTVDAECAPLETNSTWSCGRYGKAMLNADRWINNSEAFAAAGGDIVQYRSYLLNHEVGHLLGHQHVDCPAPGEPAPIMLQQSITLQGCEPNGWPYP